VFGRELLLYQKDPKEGDRVPTHSRRAHKHQLQSSMPLGAGEVVGHDHGIQRESRNEDWG